ncbi:ribosomal-processing cysteine protease Prp [Streptococcus dentapri]|uniref:Ribosomal processing cysteine protease Prp n=1 Tax=Streptococcus dentapri TaxID=573564 RepID=A0ABV8D275_9STRE
MIKATFTKDAKGWSEMTIAGHSGSGEYGFDVICASVSMLTLNFANSIEKLTGIEPGLELVDDGGFLRIAKPQGFSPDQEQVWQTLFASVVIGIENLAENAKNYVQQPVIK